MMGKKLRLIAALLGLLLLCGCGPQVQTSEPGVFSAGFGCVSLDVPTDSEQPLYIAGYRQGMEITGVRDPQQVRALWLEDGKTALLLLVVDCVGLGRGTVKEIRKQLAQFSKETGCGQIHVISTHTHAGVDTLGLWGPMAVDGKNDAFMEGLISGAVKAAEMAYADRGAGSLYYASTPTRGLQSDSRDPQVWDDHLYQIRFVPDDGSKNGIRLFSFAAHAEALRGDNTLVSRDYPGIVCDRIYAETGEDAIYIPGAIGGLIMTPELTDGQFDAEENLILTGEAIAAYALADQNWRKLEPQIAGATVEFTTHLDNTIFLYYKFLGILDNDVTRTMGGEYLLTTELSVIRLGDLTLALLPGEAFPELVYSTGENTLGAVAKAYGIGEMMVVGLANDEIGYIVPPDDFVLHEKLPYLQEAKGDHYEETNSVGPNCAADLAEAFEEALKKLGK